jgi:hypothetical protein
MSKPLGLQVSDRVATVRLRGGNAIDQERSRRVQQVCMSCDLDADTHLGHPIYRRSQRQPHRCLEVTSPDGAFEPLLVATLLSLIVVIEERSCRTGDLDL